jgi:hypothetical protein
MEVAAAAVVFAAAAMAGATVPVAFLCAVVVGMLAGQWRDKVGGGGRSGDDDVVGGHGTGRLGGSPSSAGRHDNGEDDCADPQCVRCHAYREVTSLAVERLRWYDGRVSARLREAVAVATGSAAAPTLDSLDMHLLLPTIARVGSPGPTRLQHPTVLFVPMLPSTPFASTPWATEHYSHANQTEERLPPTALESLHTSASVLPPRHSHPRMDDAAPTASLPGTPLDATHGGAGAPLRHPQFVRSLLVNSSGQQLLTDLQHELAAAEVVGRDKGWWKINTTAEGEWHVLHL